MVDLFEMTFQKKILYELIIPLILLTTGFSHSKEDSYATCYLIFAGASTNFHQLDSTAKLVAQKTGIKYENTLVYDSKRGMIVPDTSSDKMYAGSYFPRRYAEERISIEMAWYYSTGTEPDSAAPKILCIVTGIYGEKKAASANLAKVKAVVPGAYMKKVKLYQGCMH